MFFQIFFNHLIDKLSHCQIISLANYLIGKLSHWQIISLTNCLINKLSHCLIGKLGNYPYLCPLIQKEV